MASDGVEASARGVDFYMVKRSGGGMRGQYYLGFRVLVWPLEEEDFPARGVDQNVITRREGTVGC